MKPIALLLPALLLLPLFPAAAGDGKPEYELKIATQAPEKSIWGKAFLSAAAEIAKSTNGRVKIKSYPGGVQGDERTVARKIRAGQLHGAAFLAQGIVEICPDALAGQLPLQYESYEEARYVLDRATPYFDGQIDAQGFHCLGWTELGFAYLFSQQRVDTVEAFRGSKPWLIENDVYMRYLFEELGVTPVATSVTDVLTSLQTGLIQTVFSPPVALIALQWHPRVKYRLDLKLSYILGCVVVSKESWEKLPADLKDKVERSFAKCVLGLKEKVRQQDDEALEVLKTAGVESVPLDPGKLTEFKAAHAKVCKRMAGKNFSEEALNKINALIAEFRALPKKP